MNQPQQLCLSCDFQGFLVCQIPKDVIEVEFKIKTKWQSLHSTLTSIQGWGSTGAGRRSATTGYIPREYHPAMTEQAGLT